MIELYDEKGRKVASGTMVPDGGKLRVPALMMDAAGPDITAITRAAMGDAERPQAAMHRPGSAALTDVDRAAREQALAARDARLVSAWKNPRPLDTAGTEKPAPTTPAGDPAARRDARLRDAWKGAK